MRASSTGVGWCRRSSSVCQIRSMISARLRSWRSPGGGAGLGRVGQHVGQPAQLAQDGPAAGLGGVRGEHRAHRQALDSPAQSVGAGLGRDRGHRARQPALLGRPVAQAAYPVHLLGDVGQVEVRGEGAHQRRGGVDRQPGQQRPDLVAGGVAVGDPGRLLALLGQGPNLLDEVEQAGAVLAHQRVAQQLTDPAHVPAQRGVVVAGAGLAGRADEQSPPHPPAPRSEGLATEWSRPVFGHARRYFRHGAQTPSYEERKSACWVKVSWPRKEFSASQTCTSPAINVNVTDVDRGDDGSN